MLRRRKCNLKLTVQRFAFTTWIIEIQRAGLPEPVPPSYMALEDADGFVPRMVPQVLYENPSRKKRYL